jgi:hypothetical protein
MLAVLAVLLLAPPFPLPQAQQPPPAQQVAPAQPAPAAEEAATDAPPFKPEELEQIVAPIALYPDALVAQVMMAATYPLEVIQAARFAKANSKLKDTALNDELKKYDWDDSVKSLASFPQILELMNEKLDWMQKLGDAFLGQRKDTMDAIQRLRARAQAEGNLKSNEQQKVIVEQAEAQPGQPPPAQQTIVKIEPTNPQVIYVPSYNPTVVYGAWPPAYPPYYPYPPGYAWGAAAMSFGVGMAVGAAVWGGCNWGGGDVDIDVNKNNNFTNNVNRGDRATQINNERGQAGQGGKQDWKHNPEHRKGAQYRDKGSQQKYNRGGGPQAGTHDAYRGREGAGGAGQRGPQASTRESGPGAGGGGQRGGPQAGTRESGAGAGGGGQRGGPQAGTRESGAGAGGGGQRGGGGGSAFEGMGEGRQERSNSQRGQSSVGSSRASGYSSGGGGGGGRSSGAGGGASRGGGAAAERWRWRRPRRRRRATMRVLGIALALVIACGRRARRPGKLRVSGHAVNALITAFRAADRRSSRSSAPKGVPWSSRGTTSPTVGRSRGSCRNMSAVTVSRVAAGKSSSTWAKTTFHFPFRWCPMARAGSGTPTQGTTRSSIVGSGETSSPRSRCV